MYSMLPQRENPPKCYVFLLLKRPITEMEFLNVIFSREFLDINSSLLRLEVLFGFMPSFSAPQNTIHEQTQTFLFRGFL
jgi:hypothetical protein